MAPQLPDKMTCFICQSSKLHCLAGKIVKNAVWAIPLTWIFIILTSCGDPRPPLREQPTGSAIDATQKVLMAIFAHPDDESTIAPILSRYVREGVKVYLVIATDGRLGTNDFSGLEAGDGLASIRKEEMQCAASVLGVELIHLDYHDQLKAGEGYDGHMPHAQALIKEIHQLVAELQPDVLITFGPDGASNHMDHRLIGATVTSVFLSQVWERPHSLYFYGTPSKFIEDEASRMLRGVDERYLTTQISFSDEDFEKAVEALSCHRSQMQLEGLRERMESRRRDSKIYLRKFTVPAVQEEDIFE